MLQNLQNFANLKEIQRENLVDFEKCWQTHIYLQKSVPIQPKTSNILPKFCQSAVVMKVTERAPGRPVRVLPGPDLAGLEVSVLAGLQGQVGAEN